MKNIIIFLAMCITGCSTLPVSNVHYYGESTGSKELIMYAYTMLVQSDSLECNHVDSISMKIYREVQEIEGVLSGQDIWTISGCDEQQKRLITFASPVNGNAKIDITDELPEMYKIDFGNIAMIDGDYQISSNECIVNMVNGKLFNRFGARVEGLSKNGYELAFYIGRYDEQVGEYVEFTQGGYWDIGPPANPDYVAFLWEDGKQYLPGKYIFMISADRQVVSEIEFNVVEAR